MNKLLLSTIIVVLVLTIFVVIFDIVMVHLKRARKINSNKTMCYIANNLIRLNAFYFLLIFMIVWMGPLLIGLIGSFTSQYTFENDPGQLIPKDGFIFDNYINLFNKYDTDGTRLPVERWVLNSFIVSTASTLLYLMIAGFAAYAFVFLNFKFKHILFGFIIATMVIPGVATLTPQLSNIANLKLAKSLWALILPGLGGVGGLYLIRQFFLGIPKELIESARMDGISDFKIFLKIVLPLAKSVFLVQGLFCFMGSWNDLLWPQIILGTADKSLWTLQVGIAYISSGKTANAIGLSLSGAIFSAIPIIILYIFTQDRIIEGVSNTGVKG